VKTYPYLCFKKKPKAMKTKRELAEKQIELQDRVIALAKINIVTCGHCGCVLLHELTDEFITCACCKSELEQSDCPDLWYEGCQNNSEFDEDEPTNEPTKEISVADVVRVAMDLNMNPSIEEIQEVLKQYDSEAEADPTATWELIVENLLYNNVVPSHTK
jgi:hypothetical protein